MTIRAFLVEDSPSLIASVTETLQELAPVVVVGNAPGETSALHWMSANPGGCELLIVDLFLNDGSGLSVLRAAEALPVSTVLFSNYATPEIRRKAGHLGVDAVFDKSSEIESLIEYCNDLDNRDRTH